MADEVGRVIAVHKNRLACSVSTTVVGDNTTKVIHVDSAVVDFNETGGQLQHQPTGDIYSYTTADIDLETITLTAGLPSGKTFTVDDALYVYPRADDFFADVAIDDVGTDVVAARVPQMLRAILPEGHGSSQLVRVQAGGEEWHVTEMVGGEPELEIGTFYSGDIKETARTVAGGGVLVDNGWLKCDGTAVSRATFAALFNAIGTTYGVGNGTTTFAIPDRRGRAGFGAGTNIALGAGEGKVEANRGAGHTHSITSDGGHTHGSGTITSSVGQRGTGAVNTAVNPISGSTGSNGAHVHGGFTGTSLADSIGFQGMNYLIKT